MPKLKADEIKSRVADGSLTAVSLDTSIFDQYGCDLDFPLLKSLTQFKVGKITVVLSDVIVAEVTSHISDKATKTQSVLSQAIKNFSAIWKTAPKEAEVAHALKHVGDPLAFSSKSVSDFINEIEGKVISAADDTAVTIEVMRRYFAEETPFENKKEKKSEFPDAFALISLEYLFSQTKQYLLCVSHDKGWHAFAEQSNWLICAEDLDVALSYFHDSGRNIADSVVEMLKNGAAKKLINEIEESIQSRLDDVDFDAETRSGLDYEAGPESASLQSVDFSSISNPIITYASEKEVSFTLMLDALVCFEARFTFYAYDSIDKDFVTLSTEYSEIQSTHTFSLVVTVSRDLEPEPYPLDVAVVKDRLKVDFGFVEPFPNEDPMHEKY